MRRLRILNGILYAVGAFEYADGHLCNGVAKRVGGEWVNLGNLQQDVPGAPILVEVAEFAGDLYVGGSLSLADGTNGIAKFDGTMWSGPGGGILGGATAVLAMEVYGGSLYAGGEIDINSGNVGHGIMRWDGSQWHAVGGSVQDIYCGSSYPARVYELLEHDGLLLVGGGFGCAGGIPASRFAVWDGYQWCANASVMTGYVESMAFYHDTLFIACGHVVEGDSVNRVAKWVGGAYGDSCQVVAVNDPGPWRDRLRVRVSGAGVLTISGLPDGRSDYSLCDAIGRVLDTGSLAAFGPSAVEVRLPGLASGAYVFVVEGLAYRFIVAEP
ncbi:MAG: hypothetical protein IPJ76_10635 [Flavobacteriales bacterium]|nr:MAG: hypothetical protein IPJ76_10635 [Flavobacteriales bacterium]